MDRIRSAVPKSAADEVLQVQALGARYCDVLSQAAQGKCCVDALRLLLDRCAIAVPKSEVLRVQPPGSRYCVVLSHRSRGYFPLENFCADGLFLVTTPLVAASLW
jgi:hypothetical protein